jgi:Uma2 family endonuclease
MSTVVQPRQWAVAASVERRIRLTGVDWDTFRKLASSARGARFAFDRGVLEIMSPGPLHESHKGLMGDFVRITSRAMGVPRMPMGSTTWTREEADRGIEADECFYFALEKIDAASAALALKSNDPADYPPPDMAVEVDLSQPQVDRAAIYATIGVAEIWRFDSESVVIEHLQEDGSYAESPESRFLPIRAEDIRRWLLEEDSSDRAAWEDRLATWARSRRLGAEQAPQPADTG